MANPGKDGEEGAKPKKGARKPKVPGVSSGKVVKVAAKKKATGAGKGAAKGAAAKGTRAKKK